MTSNISIVCSNCASSPGLSVPCMAIFFNALDLVDKNIGARLLSPNGVSLRGLNAVSDSGPFYLTEAGTYTLVFDGVGAATGTYQFRLLDLADAKPLSLGAKISGQLK